MVFSLLFDFWTELIVLIHVYILAIIHASKELLFEADQGTKVRLEKDLGESHLLKLRHRVKCAVVTGADGTIGREVVKRLLHLHFNVHALVGDRNKAKKTFKPWLLKEKDNKLQLYNVDLSDPYSMNRFTKGFINRCGKINVVVMCAGIMMAPEQYIDNVELHMCVNVISQSILLNAIESKLLPQARIVFLSSVTAKAARFSSSLFKDRKFLSHYIGPYGAYAMSKLILSVYISQLAKKTSHCIISMHPGVVPGTLYRNTNPLLKFIIYLILPSFLRTPQFTSLLVLHTVLRNDIRSGAYYEDCDVKNIYEKVCEQDRTFIFNAVQSQIRKWSNWE